MSGWWLPATGLTAPLAPGPARHNHTNSTWPLSQRSIEHQHNHEGHCLSNTRVQGGSSIADVNRAGQTCTTARPKVCAAQHLQPPAIPAAVNGLCCRRVVGQQAPKQQQGARKVGPSFNMQSAAARAPTSQACGNMSTSNAMLLASLAVMLAAWQEPTASCCPYYCPPPPPLPPP